MSIVAKVGVFVLVGAMALIVFVPGVRQFFTRSFSNTETIVVPESSRGSVAVGIPDTGQQFELVTLLGYDAIPAILAPRFVDAEQADPVMDSDEQVLGLSINGQHRAYSVRMLSRHEIVNDEVGGVPVAVTW